MQKKKQTNIGKPITNNRGITLIALIITIIVMLILVAVTVNIAVNSGLFGHAKDATNKWADEQNKEANIGDDVDKIIKEQVGIHNWIRSGDDIHCNHCGLSFVIGDYLDYQPDPTSKNIVISDEESGLADMPTEESGENASLKNNNIQLTTLENTNNSVTIEQLKEAGIEISDNIFTQDAETYWQVMGVEDSDGNGTNETLLIKLEGATEEKLSLYGAASYNNGPNIMNRVCKELYSSKYGVARSITEKDINNTFEYIPENTFYEDNEWNLHAIEMNIYVKDLPTWNTIISNGTITPDGSNTETKLGMYNLNGYCYLIEAGKIKNPITNQNITISENATNVILKNKLTYWIACNGIGSGTWGRDMVILFGPGVVEKEGIYSYSGGLWSYGEKRLMTYSICPVIQLRNEIPPIIYPK